MGFHVGPTGVPQLPTGLYYTISRTLAEPLYGCATVGHLQP